MSGDKDSKTSVAGSGETKSHTAVQGHKFETLGKAMVWNTYGRISQTVLKFLSVIILAQAMGPAGVGIFAVAVSAARLLSLPIVSGTAHLAEREISGAFGNGRIDLARMALRYLLASVPLFAVLGALIQTQILNLLGLPETGALPLISAALALFIANVATGAVRGIVRGEGQTGLAMLPFNLVALLSVAGYLAWHLGVQDLSAEIAIWIHASAQFLVLPIWIWMAVRYWPRVEGEGEAASTGSSERIPSRWYSETAQFMLLGATTVAFTEAGTLLLAYFSTPEEVGLFRVATRFYILAMFTVTLARGAFSPQVAKLWRAGQVDDLAHNARTLAAMSLLFSLTATLLFAVLGPFLVPVVFGADFASAFWPALILFFTSVVAGLSPVSGRMLKMAGFQSWVTVAALLALATVIGLNVILAPIYGALGCAISFFVATIVARTINNLGVRKQMGFDPRPDQAAFRTVRNRLQKLVGKVRARAGLN